METQTAAKATYKQLRDGSWGVSVVGRVVGIGDQITVTKKSGETKIETINAILWSEGDKAICAIAQRRASQGYSRRRGGSARYECEECGEDVTPGTRCWETGCSH